MPLAGQKRKRQQSHPYLSGNFAPIQQTRSLTPCTYTGNIPDGLVGGQYVRNGGNPVSNQDLGRDAHWFDGDGMLAGVLFQRSRDGPIQPTFVNQYVLTDVNLSAASTPSLRTPILPSITSLVNPASSLVFIIWRILRTVLLTILSFLPGSRQKIARISVANTSILYHDGRALATCESGPPMRVHLPELDTVGWFDGDVAEGEPQTAANGATFGASGLIGFMKEWTTGHPKVDPLTKEMILFHCTFIRPYVHYSVIPASHQLRSEKQLSRKLTNVPVPGVSGAKMMHDFGVSRTHTIIMDLPLSLDPLNLVKNRPIVSYDYTKKSRFGVFPRHDPSKARWFETTACCIFHTANAWDSYDVKGNVLAVNMLACRLTSATLVFSAGNMSAPRPQLQADEASRKRVSFFARYDDDKVWKEDADDETSPLLPNMTPSHLPSELEKASNKDLQEEQCRLYLYTFPLAGDESQISEQFALSCLPFEFPTLNSKYAMTSARYIYGCSTYTSSFGAALGKATKIDVLLKMDVETLVRNGRGQNFSNGRCVDERTIEEVLASEDEDDTIKAFRMPAGWYAQEATFVPKTTTSTSDEDVVDEDDGYLLFYAFDESQLNEEGTCPDSAVSELWIIDAKSMKDVIAKVTLPQRVPYGLHGNWFSEDMINDQRPVGTLRSLPVGVNGSLLSAVRQKFIAWLS